MRQTFSRIDAGTSAQTIGDSVTGAIDDAFSGNTTTQIGNGSFRMGFAGGSPDDGKPVVAEANDAMQALAYGGSAAGYLKAPPYLKAPIAIRSPWSVWIDGHFTGFDDHGPSTFDGWHTDVTGGVGYRFSDRFVAGVYGTYENARYSLGMAGVPASLNADGGGGGAYFGWKFWNALRLDGALGYSRLNYDAAAGGVTGAFGADRVTGMGRLSGRYGLGIGYVEPSATLTIASERQDAFTDTAGVGHGTFDFTVGRASTGATIGVPIPWNLCIITPTVGAYADYRFGDQVAAAASVVPTFDNGFSAHVNGGLNIAMPHGVTASALGEYGGLGEEVRYWRAKGSLGVAF